MAKKSSFLRNLKRSRKTTPKSQSLRVESLESRQLYAVVTGSGQEVVSDKVNPDGVTYDQILMTGSSVSVTNDVGQVTRVSFLDNDGDIVQVALIGNGTLNVSLDGAKTGVAPSNYTQTGINYVQGDATITITGSDAGTSVQVYSVGGLYNTNVVDATHRGGDHWADLSRIIIVGNEKNEAGYTNFGSIYAGNASFSASSGVVGIRAENVAVQGVVRIGDIDAKESGVPTLYFNSNSQFQTVFVQGGDLKQSNGASFDTFGNGNAGGTGNNSSAGGVSLGGFAFFNSTDGLDSNGVLNADKSVDVAASLANGSYYVATPINQDAIRLAAVDQQTIMKGTWTVDISNPASVKVTSSVYGDLSATVSGLSLQAALDQVFERRTFDGNITIKGDLPANIEINLADVRDDAKTSAIEGNLTFDNNLFGSLVIDGYGASVETLTVKGNLDGHVLVRGTDRVTGGGDGQQNAIGKLVVGQDTGAYADIRAEEIGSVIIAHNFSGLISTNVRDVDAFGRDIINPLPNSSTQWTGTERTGTGYVDVDGKIGNVTIGYGIDGTGSAPQTRTEGTGKDRIDYTLTYTGGANGGSIINGTIQGVSGIGDVKVGGDIVGSPIGNGVFETSSNPGAAPTDVRNYGTASIGNITVAGDADLDTVLTRFVSIDGNGKYGDIAVAGQVITAVETKTTYKEVTAPDTTLPPTGARWLSVFGPALAAGENTWTNQDFDGTGPLGRDYIVGQSGPTTNYTITNTSLVVSAVTARPDDVGKVVNATDSFRIFREGSNELLTGATKAGDKIVPGTLAGDTFTPAKDGFGNYLFWQNTLAGKVADVTTVVPDKTTTTTTILAGNRGTLDGVYNNFGSIYIGSAFGAQQAVSGTITWSDSVDMTFGGVLLNAAGENNFGVISTQTIGAISITNTGLGVARVATAADGEAAAGKLTYEHSVLGTATATAWAGDKADLLLGGRIGDATFDSDVTNMEVGRVGLAGLTVGGKFETIVADAQNVGGEFNDNGVNAIIAVDSTNSGISLSTVAGDVARGLTPTVSFVDKIVLNDGTAEVAQKATLTINTGMVNSNILFGENSGIVVTSGPNTGNFSEIAPLTLAADYVEFKGILMANKIGALTLTGGTGIGSLSDTAVSFTGSIIGDTVGDIVASTTHGDLIFAPAMISAVSQPNQSVPTSLPGLANVGTVTLTTANPNNGGNIRLGSSETYNANFKAIEIDAAHSLYLGNSGQFLDNVGNVTITLATTGNVESINVETTTGNIANDLFIRGNVGDITYKAGVAAVTDADLGKYAGDKGDLVRAGNIVANQTIYGNRGTTTLTTAKDGVTLKYDGADYAYVPAGSVSAVLNYAGGDATDNLVIQTGRGEVNVTLRVIGNDDNLNGVVSATEMGHGGNVAITSVAGDINFAARTPTPGNAANLISGAAFQDYIHESTLGNVTVATGTVKGVNDAFDGTYGAVGSVELKFNDTNATPAKPGIPASDSWDLIGSWGPYNDEDNWIWDYTGHKHAIDPTPAKQTGFEGKVGNISATTTAGSISLVETRFDNNVGDVTLTAGTATDSEGIHAGSIQIGTDGYLVGVTKDMPAQSAAVIFNGSHGTISATTKDLGNIHAQIEMNGVSTSGLVFSGEYGSQLIQIAAGSYDTNGNTLITAGEYARTGNIGVSSLGGNVTVALSSTAYASETEQSKIGNVTITNQTSVFERLGQDDIWGVTPDNRGAGLDGDIAILGDASSKGAVGNITASTVGSGKTYDMGTPSTTDDVTTRSNSRGDILLAGKFGNVGNIDLKTGATYDPDYIVNNDPSKNPFDQVKYYESGTIRFGIEDMQDSGGAFTPFEINGSHGTITSATLEEGSIRGAVLFAASKPTADSAVGAFKATTEFGKIDLALWTADADRNGNGVISTATELGHSGDITLASIAGSIDLRLLTDIRNEALAKKNTAEGLTFGDVTVTTGDSYDNGKGADIDDNDFTDGVLRGYLAGEVSAKDADIRAATGSITIVGGGADATNPFAAFGKALEKDVEDRVASVTGNRGSVGDITATVDRGTVGLYGTFNNVEDITLKANTYGDDRLDSKDKAYKNAFAGTIEFGDVSGGALTFTGRSGTATLTTYVDGQTDTVDQAGSVTGGGITGNVHYMGDSRNAKAIVASTGSSNITLDVTASWFDINGDGKITDVNNQVVQGVASNEFAKIGSIELTSALKSGASVLKGTNPGDITLGLAVGTADNSTVGSEIGAITAKSYSAVIETAEKNDSMSNGNITITGKSPLPLTAGTVGDITADLGEKGSGDITVKGNFINVGSFALTTGSHTDTSNADKKSAVAGAGDIILGNSTAGAAASADTTTYTTLNIAGSYKDSTLKVLETGTIQGDVFVGGSNGQAWNLTSNVGKIEVGFTAGFEANGTADIQDTEAGKIGNITAKSLVGSAGTVASYGDVTLYLGTAHEKSVIGDVTASTGDGASAFDAKKASETGTWATAYAGSVKIEGINNSYLGNIGNIAGTVGSDTVTLTGSFGGVGNVTLAATESYVDREYNDAITTEVPKVIRAGDVDVNGTKIAGLHGKVTLTTTDSGKLTADEKLVATYDDAGTIGGTISFAGGLRGTTTIGVDATTERGAITVNVAAGFDTAADANTTVDETEAGNAGAVNLLSTLGGSITSTVGTWHAKSIIGAITAETRDVLRPLAAADDTSVAANVTIKGDHTAGADLGTVGTVNLTVGTGTATLQGDFGAIGDISFKTATRIDTDYNTDPAVTNEEPKLWAAGDIRLGVYGSAVAGDALRIGGTYGSISVAQKDASVLDTAHTALDAAGNKKSQLTGTIANTADVEGNIYVAGKAADGAVFTIGTERGTIKFQTVAGYDYNDSGAIAETAESGSFIAQSYTSSNGGNVTVDLGTAEAKSVNGNVTVSATSVYKIVAEGNDTPVSVGTSTITGLSAAALGTQGDITAQTLTGLNKLDGQFNNLGLVTLGAITNRYVDNDTAGGTGDPLVVINAADVNVGSASTLTVTGTHKGFVLAAGDNATVGAEYATYRDAATNVGIGNVDANLILGGSFNGVAATGSVNILTQAGNATLDLYANNATDATTLGKITAKSSFGAIDLGVATTAKAKVGEIYAETSHSYVAETKATTDAAAFVGTININTTTGLGSDASAGELGNITAKSGAGNITFGGTYDNKVGNIDLAAGAYEDQSVDNVATPHKAYTHAGNVTFVGTFASNAATTVGSIKLTASGAIDDTLVGVAQDAGDVTVNGTTFGGAWADVATGSNVANQIDAGEVKTFKATSFSAAVTDGVLGFNLGNNNTTGYGIDLTSIELKSTGGSTAAGTGNIVIGGNNTTNFASLKDFSATAETGDVTWTFDTVFQAPTISNIDLISKGGNGANGNGTVALNGKLLLNVPNALNYNGSVAANNALSITDVKFSATNGNVSIGEFGEIGEAINYGASNLVVASGVTKDTRTATISDIVLEATNGGVGSTEDGTSDGCVTINGIIGGNDISAIKASVAGNSAITLTNGGAFADRVTLNSDTTIDHANIVAWQIGKITVNGTSAFTNATVANILADDSNTSRQYVGEVDYSAVSSATVTGEGSILNKIDELVFNGAVFGGANTLRSGAVGEIVASTIGNITIDADIDPTSTIVSTVTAFDVIAAPQTGEFILASNALAGVSPTGNAATNKGVFATLDQYSIGNISITHTLQGASAGTAVFDGVSSFVAGGKVGNIDILSTISGSVQAPLFADAAADSAWFVVGDINASLSTVNTAVAYGLKTTTNAALATLPAAVLTVGDVTVNAGGSINAYPNPTEGDLTNGAGFALAVGVDVNAAGNYYSAAGVVATRIAGPVDATAETFYGRIGDVSFQNYFFRPDGYTMGAAPTVSVRPGAVVVAGDDVGTTDEIADMVNELTPNGDVPMNEGQYYIVGDADADDNADSANDIVVYVL